MYIFLYKNITVLIYNYIGVRENFRGYRCAGCLTLKSRENFKILLKYYTGIYAIGDNQQLYGIQYNHTYTNGVLHMIMYALGTTRWV